MSHIAAFAARFGEIKQVDSGCEPSQSASVRRTRYRWRPSSLIQDYLPADFSMDFDCLDSEGVRRLVPACATPAFVGRASLAGLAILRVQKSLSAESVSIYHLMRLLFQLSPQIRERLDRRLTCWNELQSRQYSREESSVVPIGVGTGDAAGESWSLNMLIQRIGANAARNDGHIDPDLMTRLSYGIDQDALQRPMDLDQMTGENVLQSLRLVLFDAGPCKNLVDHDLKARVYSRLVDALEKHLADPAEYFHQWFFEKFDNIIHQISKRKKPDGEIPRNQVRQTLLELIFDSWQYVGQTVSLCMHAVNRSFSPSLTISEEAVFKAVYQRQEAFGQIPLILLSDQFPMIQPTVIALLENPQDRRNWGRLHRALETYALMLIQRRDLDRSLKQIRPPQHPYRNCEDEEDVVMDVEVKKAKKKNRFCKLPDEVNENLKNIRKEAAENLAENLREELKGILWKNHRWTEMDCHCSDPSEWTLEFVNILEERQTVKLKVACQQCQTVYEQTHSVAELQSMVKESTA